MQCNYLIELVISYISENLKYLELKSVNYGLSHLDVYNNKTFITNVNVLKDSKINKQQILNRHNKHLYEGIQS